MNDMKRYTRDTKATRAHSNSSGACTCTCFVFVVGTKRTRHKSLPNSLSNRSRADFPRSPNEGGTADIFLSKDRQTATKVKVGTPNQPAGYSSTLTGILSFTKLA